MKKIIPYILAGVLGLQVLGSGKDLSDDTPEWFQWHIKGIEWNKPIGYSKLVLSGLYNGVKSDIEMIDNNGDSEVDSLNVIVNNDTTKFNYKKLVERGGIQELNDNFNKYSELQFNLIKEENKKFQYGIPF